MPPVSIVIPTRRRPAYLEAALASVAGQAGAAGAEILVIDDDGPSPEGRALAERFGARYEPHPAPLGLNAARNTGVERSSGELVVFLDDDISAAPDWLGALLKAVEEHPGTDVFAGRITARLEGSPPRSCGREAPAITTLDLGEHDIETPFAWGANMAIRRSALDRVGPFDLSLAEGGDEQEWQERLTATSPSARTLYVAGALVEHRRAGQDSRLRSLCRGARIRGRAARRFDSSRGSAPSLSRELLTLARCVGHVVRRRCPAGLTMVAHSAGRLQAAVGERSGTRLHSQARPGPVADDFLSGASGTVGGLGASARGIADEILDAAALAGGRSRRLARAAAQQPPRRRVLILGVWRAERASLTGAIRAELLSSRHEIELHTRSPGEAGKFENLDLLLAEHGAAGHDWLVVVDDDVRLPHGFLDGFLFLSERFSLSLSQPAHRLNSHAAWAVTRRRAWSAVRETSFVEIGPVTAFAAVTFPVLLPFPRLRMGWGLDTHWAALARANGWRIGVVDALPIGHRTAPAAASYSRQDAVEEARAFLAERPHLSAGEAQRTLATHRRW
jgi:GT2 family glycosyltransferase